MWSDCEPFDPEQWEIVWHGGSHHDCEPPPPRPPDVEPVSVTAALKRFLQKHAPKAYRPHVLAPRVGFRMELVRDRLRSMEKKGYIVKLQNAEGHDVYAWAGRATKNYTLRQPDKRIRLQGAA